MNIYESLAQAMSDENAITLETARGLVNWLVIEGILDYDVMRETYISDEVA